MSNNEAQRIRRKMWIRKIVGSIEGCNVNYSSRR